MPNGTNCPMCGTAAKVVCDDEYEGTCFYWPLHDAEKDVLISRMGSLLDEFTGYLRGYIDGTAPPFCVVEFAMADWMELKEKGLAK